MPRPSRAEEALQVLRAYYRDNGILPTIETITKLMGYRSPGSTYPVIKSLVRQGFLSQEEKGGQLKPGPQFQVSHSPQTRSEVELSYPAHCQATVATVATPALGILEGDTLVYDREAVAAPGDVLVLQPGDGRVIAHRLGQDEAVPEAHLGVVLFQYRHYP